MQFTLLPAFWLAFTLPAILAMYILRPRRRRWVVPSTLLWRPVQASLEASLPWQKLQRQLLLWLQLAAAALFVLAAAGPVIYWGRPSSSLIVLVDISASMQATDVAPSRLARAREEVLRLARGLERGATITVIAFDRQPRVVVRGTQDVSQAEEILAGLEATPFAGDLAAALSLATSLARQEPESRLVVVGDGGYRAGLPPEAEFIQVGRAGENVALAGLEVRAGEEGPAAQVAVVNHGSRPASGRVILEAGRREVGARTWQLEPGETSYLLWPELPAASFFQATLEVDDPAANLLALDDRAWAVVRADRRARVLLVSEGNLFLEKALSVIPGLELYRAAPQEYPSLLGAGYDYQLTVLDGLAAPLPPGAVFLVDPPPGRVLPGLVIGREFRPGPLNLAAASAVWEYVDTGQFRVAVAREMDVASPWIADVVAGGRVVAAHGEEGGTRAVVLGFDLQKSDLPLRPGFPILIQNAVHWLLPPDLGVPPVVKAGEEVAVTALPLAEVIAVTGPDGEVEELAPPFPPSSWVPQSPGIYSLTEKGAAGDLATVRVAVNAYDPQEAALAPGDPRPADSEGTTPEDRPVARAWPLAFPLALGALALVMLEWGVASRGR